jgi:wyosine [tRNA(Phe)-imidazoG37] synthetase (radical SAM superfamily)
VVDHDRSFAGMKYVYPVVSRRAGGVSIGINLNPNNACNWRCVYCQVPDLTRGAAPVVDWAQFESELTQMLDAICHGSYLAEHAPPEARTLKDFALSGNGEPTSCPDFERVIQTIGEARVRYGLADDVKLVLISNGSLVSKPEVQRGLRLLANLGGEVWFKLDRGSDVAVRATNGTRVSLSRHLRRLRITAELCRTWVQTCWYSRAGEDPLPADVNDYVACLERALRTGIQLAGVQLYTLARKPLLPEGFDLGALSGVWMSNLAARVAQLGIRVVVS